MKEENLAHETSTSLVMGAPAEVDAGSEMALMVKVACASKCNLQNGLIRILDESGAVIKEIELVSFDGTAGQSDEFVVQAPNRPGSYSWTAVLSAMEKQSVLHAESTAPISFVVSPHATSMAVWDVLTPIVRNTRFKIKVGVQCAAQCHLAGQLVEIIDHAQARAAVGTLGDTPWSSTSVLYWTEVELLAPSGDGYYNWTARFTHRDVSIAHSDSALPFSFGTVGPPDHVVTVEVVAKDEQTPIMDAQVILHPYQGVTDEQGRAKIAVTQGEYHLWIPRIDKYDIFRATLEVEGDQFIKAELMAAPVDES